MEIGIMATPPEAVQKAAEMLVKAGVKAVLNFAPVRISFPPANDL